jgi:hypothetical protein
MRRFGSRCRRHLALALWAGCAGGAVGCSVYEASPPAASAGGAGNSTTATTGAGGDPTGTSSASTSTDTTAAATGPGAGGTSGESVTVGTAGSGSGGAGTGGEGGGAGSSAGTGPGGSGITDASPNDSSTPDASGQDAEASPPPTPQTLPPHGIATLTNLAVPFTSPCNSDEVVIGFSIRAGAWTDAIASICSKFSDGMLGAIRILPLNGKPDGGNPQQMLCPTNFVASGVVGNYGHSNRFNVDEMTGLGVVCREIANPANLQVVAVSQAPLDSDAGMIAFREDCTLTRWLTSMSGTLDNNAVSGQAVVRLGGECNSR